MSNLSSEVKKAFIKSIAIFEDTVDGIGSPSLLQHLVPLLEDDEINVLDWILKNTNSYCWYGHGAKSLKEYDEIIRQNKERAERNIAKEKEKQKEAAEKRAIRATSNLPNAVRRGGQKSCKRFTR